MGNSWALLRAASAADRSDTANRTERLDRQGARRRTHVSLQLEGLEHRALLTATAVPEVEVISDKVGSKATSAAVAGLTASEIKSAYSLAGLTFSNGTVAADGSGQTIAIIDAYNDANIKSDLATFDSTMGLATANLTVVNQSGGTTALPKSNTSWSLETSLDVEWAHAIAPGAKILLVEANSDNLTDLMSAVKYAENVAGVSVVSMSWGVDEFNGETSYDSYFSHTGVTFVGASGDSGSPAIWPALSPNVLAVGGTTLNVTSSGSYSSETAWSDSGGGTSVYESEPSYQTGVQSTGKRTAPDVSYDANPNTGFAVYDSLDGGWQEVGGTSAGAPQWAAILAIANQGRAIAGESALTGGQAAVYSLSSSDFHDITSGGNGGYSAKSGYDEVTGRGTPIGNLVIAGLVGSTSSTSSSGSSGTGSSGTGSSGSGSSGSGSSGSSSSGTGSSGSGSSGSGSSGKGSSGTGSSGSGSSGSSGSGSSGSGSSGSSGGGHGRGGGYGFGYGFGGWNSFGGFFGGGYFGPFYGGYSFGFMVETGSTGSDSASDIGAVAGNAAGNSTASASGSSNLTIGAGSVAGLSQTNVVAFNSTLTSIATSTAPLGIVGATTGAMIDQAVAGSAARFASIEATDLNWSLDELASAVVAGWTSIPTLAGGGVPISALRPDNPTTPAPAGFGEFAALSRPSRSATETVGKNSLAAAEFSTPADAALLAAVWSEYETAEENAAASLVEPIAPADADASETIGASSIPTPLALAAVGATIVWARQRCDEQTVAAPRRKRLREPKSAR